VIGKFGGRNCDLFLEEYIPSACFKGQKKTENLNFALATSPLI
jgi:hypothetical protein